MSKISDVFKNNKALITFIMAGDPSLKKTEDIAVALAQSGADIIEIGLPFSDSIADGPVIAESAQRAIRRNVTPQGIFRSISRIRKKTAVPIVLMTSFNIVCSYGMGMFMRDASAIGVDALILPDLTPEESAVASEIAVSNGIDLIFLVSPNSSSGRIKKAVSLSGGFVYMVSVAGTTGIRKKLSTGLEDFSKKIREFTNKPVAVGFGISDPTQAAKASKYADGVIVGSALVHLIHTSHGNIKKIRSFVRAFKTSLTQ